MHHGCHNMAAITWLIPLPRHVGVREVGYLPDFRCRADVYFTCISRRFNPIFRRRSPFLWWQRGPQRQSCERPRLQISGAQRTWKDYGVAALRRKDAPNIAKIANKYKKMANDRQRSRCIQCLDVERMRSSSDCPRGTLAHPIRISLDLRNGSFFFSPMYFREFISFILRSSQIISDLTVSICIHCLRHWERIWDDLG